MKAYLDIVEEIFSKGKNKPNRTGVDAITITGAVFEHDMSKGFPLLTTKKTAYKPVRSELEFFIKGLTDKKWLQDRGNRIWNEWCSPEKVPYGHDDETQEKMAAERDLGPIYGWQWRHFGAEYQGYDADYTGQGVDQLENLVNKLKTDPSDRRMIVSAWNPLDNHKMALPPCHYSFHVSVVDGKLDLIWNQRSVDTMLGLPFNIASYATLLHLLSLESDIPIGKLRGHLEDVHIYANQVDGAKEQLTRTPYDLPTIVTDNFKSLFDWEYTQTKLKDYKSHPKIEFPIAV